VVFEKSHTASGRDENALAQRKPARGGTDSNNFAVTRRSWSTLTLDLILISTLILALSLSLKLDPNPKPDPAAHLVAPNFWHAGIG